MTGHVDPHLAVLLPVRILGDGAASIVITATVDTGFTAYCTLPRRLVLLLNLPYYADIEAQMGDGRIVSLRVFRAGIQ